MPVTVASLEAVLNLNKKGFDDGLKKSSAALGKFGGALKTGIVGGAAAATGALVGVSSAAFDFQRDLDNATAALAADLGVTKDEASEFEGVMKDIFANNFGEGFEDIGAAVGLINKQLGDLPDKELQQVAEGVFSISDAFDKDLAEVVDAQKVLMEEFGLTSTQALDFVSAGFQKGLDRSGDFTDSIREYGNLFGDAGATAEQFFSTLQTGAEGGVLGTDKIADAFKEFQLRVLEGDKAVLAATESLFGDDLGMFQAEIAAGDTTVTEFFDKVVKGLDSIEDPIQKQAMGVAFFGTQFEDLGASMTEGLNVGQTAMEDLAGSTEALGGQYDTLGAKFEGIKRQALTALAPLGEVITDNLMMFLEQAMPVIQEFAATLTETLGPATLLINDALTRMGAALGITNEEVTAMDVAINVLKGVLDAIVIAIQLVAVTMQGLAFYIETVRGNWQAMADTFTATKDAIANAGSALGDNIPDWLIPGSPTPFEMGIRGITAALDGMSAAVPNAGANGGNTTVNMGGQSFSFANDAAGQNQALMTVFQMLRAQLEAA